MISFSRRQLAQYAVNEMAAGNQKGLPARLAAALRATGRVKEADLLLADIERELEDRGLMSSALITTAHPLPEKLGREITAEIKKLTGASQIILDSEIDKAVLGGFKVETANHSWDKTVRRLLKDLRRAV